MIIPATTYPFLLRHVHSCYNIFIPATTWSFLRPQVTTLTRRPSARPSIYVATTEGGVLLSNNYRLVSRPRHSQGLLYKHCHNWFINSLSYPLSEFWNALITKGFDCRHGICQGFTDIIRVKFLVTGVKCSYDHMQFVVNSLHVAFWVCSVLFYVATTAVVLPVN